MSENSFYLMMVELSGTLLGLAFVGITHHFNSLGTDLFSDPRVNLKGKALWTCVFDSAVLSLSLLLLPFCASLLMLTVTPESDAVKIGVGLVGLIWAAVMLVVFREKLYARRMGQTYEYESELPLRVEDYIQLVLAVLVTGLLSIVLLLIGSLPLAVPSKFPHVSLHEIDGYVRVVCVVYVIGGLMALYNDLFSPYPLTTYPAESALLTAPEGGQESALQRIRRVLRLLPHKEVAPGDGPGHAAFQGDYSPPEAPSRRTPRTTEAVAARLDAVEDAYHDLLQAWDAGEDIRAFVELGGELDSRQLDELQHWLVEMRRREESVIRQILLLECMIVAGAQSHELRHEVDGATGG